MVKIGDVELGDFPLLLAPMEDVSDPPFRALCKKQGCDMMYSEFISVEGLIRDATKSVEKLDIFDYERPIGIQIFGANLDSMIRATEIVEEANPNENMLLGSLNSFLAHKGALTELKRFISIFPSGKGCNMKA